MANFVASISDVLGTFSEHRYLDDGVDRLNRIYAPVILISTASILGVVQFFGDPIECTMDNRQAPTDYVKDYIKSWCWTHGTFDNVQTKNPIHINYYQWVPVVIAIQAFCFQLPYIFWSNMAVAGGMNLAHVLKGADKLCEVGTDAEEHGRDVICEDTCHIIDSYFKRNLILGRRSWKKKTLFNLTLSFFFAKILYILNIVVQIHVVDGFLQGRRATEVANAGKYEDHHENVIQYAVRAMKSLVVEGHWRNSWRFPMLAMCRYYSEGRLAFGCQNPVLDRYGRKRCPYDGEVLCTLPLNLYNDKVFAVMTLLMLILLLLNIVVFLGWLCSVFLPLTRSTLVRKILVKQNREDNGAVTRFIDSYLRTDGILVLKLIRTNLGVNATTEVVECLFTFFQKLESNRRFVADEDRLDGARRADTNGNLRPTEPPQLRFSESPEKPAEQQEQEEPLPPRVARLMELHDRRHQLYARPSPPSTLETNPGPRTRFLEPDGAGGAGGGGEAEAGTPGGRKSPFEITSV